jgi:cation diffusion facilitator CzcD-associated flavoprotein CzcO
MSGVDTTIIGAGPYGLALAAHLVKRGGNDIRVFGEPMGSWKNHMPAGMLLKSYPWASNIADPDSHFTVKNFCTMQGVPYHDYLTAVPLETFIEYGEAFQQRYVPFVERRMLVALQKTSTGFSARFDNDETVHARRVIIAVGISPFKYLPPIANGFPPEAISHSADYGPFDRLVGKRVAVIGSGSSATDLAALLHESGIAVTLIARSPKLDFAGSPRVPSWIERAIAPDSGIGEGWSMGVCARAPWLVNMMPEDIRLRLAYTKALGPLGGAFMRDRVIGKFATLLARHISEIKVRDKVHLKLSGGKKNEIVTADHVVFATGYKPDIDRLGFLDQPIAAEIRKTRKAPRLSHHYESSVPGLYFIGPAAAPSFGPVCRFVFGSFHPARHLSA